MCKVRFLFRRYRYFYYPVKLILKDFVCFFDVFEGEVVAIIHRTNDDDDKLVVMEKGKNYTDEQIRVLTEFQEQWFDSVIIRK